MPYGNPTRNFRCEDEVWERYGAAVRYRGTDKSKPIHDFVMRYVLEAEAEQEEERKLKLLRRRGKG
jgi:hypothetical protein